MDRAKLKKKLLHKLGQAIADFHMIKQNDRIMVCVSGGKDSCALLDLLADLQQRAPVSFELLAVHLDQQQPGFSARAVEDHLAGCGVPYRIVSRGTYRLVQEKTRQGKNVCALCSRFRRGIMYKIALEEGCSRIALGHHADDIVQTLLINLFFNGTLKTMPPVLRSDDGRNTVIRPFAYCWESELEAFAKLQNYPVASGAVCGLPDKSRRKRMRRLVEELEVENPHIRNSLLAALSRVIPSHLMDRDLFDFKIAGFD